MFFSIILSGDFMGAVRYCTQNPLITSYLVVYTLLAYVAISLHMGMVKNFGSVPTVLVGNSRKAMTITLSFLLFPKPFSINYIVGGALVLGGLTVSAYMKSARGNSQS